MAAVNFVLFAYQLVSGDLKVINWLGLLVNAPLAGFFGWCSVVSCSIPVVKLTANRIELRHIGSTVRKRVSLAELVGLRWQDSFDLRLCARSGAEYSIHLSDIGRHDRRRLDAVLRERIGLASLT